MRAQCAERSDTDYVSELVATHVVRLLSQEAIGSANCSVRSAQGRTCLLFRFSASGASPSAQMSDRVLVPRLWEIGKLSCGCGERQRRQHAKAWARREPSVFDAKSSLDPTARSLEFRICLGKRTDAQTVPQKNCANDAGAPSRSRNQPGSRRVENQTT